MIPSVTLHILVNEKPELGLSRTLEQLSSIQKISLVVIRPKPARPLQHLDLSAASEAYEARSRKLTKIRKIRETTASFSKNTLFQPSNKAQDLVIRFAS